MLRSCCTCFATGVCRACGSWAQVGRGPNKLSPSHLWRGQENRLSLLGRESGLGILYRSMEVELLSASVLDRVPGWHGRPRTAEPLTGGITNRNYRVAVDHEVFVVRVPAKSGSLLGIDRGIEREASRLAAAAGVGPDVIA